MTCESYHKFFETMSSKSRWKILELLTYGSKNVSEICEALKEEQSKVSHNLKILADCNIIAVEQKGKQRHYSLNKQTIYPLMLLVEKHVSKYCTCGCKRQ